MAPILLILLVNVIAPKAVQFDKLKHLLNDLTIIFLSSAMIAEVSIEAFLCKIKFSKYAYLAFFVSSAMILGIACIAYTVIITRDENSISFHNIWVSRQLL
jgi:hypothetical protein